MKAHDPLKLREHLAASNEQRELWRAIRRNSRMSLLISFTFMVASLYLLINASWTDIRLDALESQQAAPTQEDTQ